MNSSEAREASEQEEVEDEQEPDGDSLHSEDEEEYDSEEEDSDNGRGRKRKKKDRFGGFIIDEAEVCICLSSTYLNLKSFSSFSYIYIDV